MVGVEPHLSQEATCSNIADQLAPTSSLSTWSRAATTLARALRRCTGSLVAKTSWGRPTLPSPPVNQPGGGICDREEESTSDDLFICVFLEDRMVRFGSGCLAERQAE